MVTNWAGPPAMLAIFRKFFGSFAAPNIIRQNNFQNFQHYHLQKTIPIAMAGLRNAHGICPPEVIRFLLDLFKYNDNLKNRFSDNYYKASLVEALGNTVTPVISVAAQGTMITAESLSADTKLILEEITRMLNLEKALPCYKYTVSVACLKAIRKLQKFGHLPSQPTLFKSYAAYGNFIDVRLAALDCLVDFVRADGKWHDLAFVLDILENDPDPGLKHQLAILLQKTPPFKRAHRGKLDVPELVERLWTNINCMLSHDTRLRCDIVDLYYALYGTKRPVCIPLIELSGIMNLNKHDPNKKSNKPLQSPERTSPIPHKKIDPPSTAPKDVPPQNIIMEPVECMDVEIVATDEKFIKEEDIMDIKIETSDITKQEYFSDNSVSLPGMGQIGPVGFEPGMFKKEDESKPTSESPSGKAKKKKKDKKKHKHKHKHKHEHKHNKDKDKKDKERGEGSKSAKLKEDTLSSMSSSPSPNPLSVCSSETI